MRTTHTSIFFGVVAIVLVIGVYVVTTTDASTANVANSNASPATQPAAAGNFQDPISPRTYTLVGRFTMFIITAGVTTTVAFLLTRLFSLSQIEVPRPLPNDQSTSSASTRPTPKRSRKKAASTKIRRKPKTAAPQTHWLGPVSLTSRSSGDNATLQLNSQWNNQHNFTVNGDPLFLRVTNLEDGAAQFTLTCAEIRGKGNRGQGSMTWGTKDKELDFNGILMEFTLGNALKRIEMKADSAKPTQDKNRDERQLEFGEG